MYEAHFGLSQEPFSIAPDPRFLYLSEKHREALAHLNYGLGRGASFVLLTGEIGAGKTTVWRKFLEELPSNFDVANVVNPKLDVTALLSRICDDLGVAPPTDGRAVDLIDALHGHLLLASADGRRTLVVIDEAQALSMDVLEQLRLLTNLDTSGRKLQVLLIGQPELRQILERPQLEPLAQRVVTRYHLPALSEAETASYIEHRLLVAGLTGPMPFDAESLQLIHRLSRGVPRRINVLCDLSLLGAQAQGTRRVDRRLVEGAAAEISGRPLPAREPDPAEPPSAQGGSGALPKVLAFGVVAGLTLAAGVLLAPRLMGRAAQPPAAATPAPAAPAQTLAPAPVAAAPAAPPAAAPAVAALPAAVSPLAPATPAVAAALPLADAVFGPGAADEAPAWRVLAGRWGVTLAPGEPCAVAPLQSLRCHRTRGGLASIRQIDRPGLLRLVDERGRSANVVLVALAGDSARLLVAGGERDVPLAQLGPLWRGDFATFWRAPAGYREGEDVAALGTLGLWLAERLSRVDGGSAVTATDEALRSRVAAFQLAQGLVPDGVAGPRTLMQLSRLTGSDEPRLAPAAAPRP